MTAAPFPPPQNCPSSLIASCAPLLGFTPDNCLVAFIHAVPGRSEPVLLRCDLPTGPAIDHAASQVARGILGTGGVAVDTIAWIADPDGTPRGELSSTSFLSSLDCALAAVGIEVGATLSTNGGVWWSHACSEPRCCPESATALDPSIVDAVRAEFVYAGYAPLGSRAELARRVARDEVRAAEVGRVLARTSATPTNRWRAAQLRFLADLLLAPDSCRVAVPTLSVARSARVLRALADIRVRDAILRRLVLDPRTCPECWSTTVDTLCQALRAAPPGATAPPATVLGLVTWMRGEGALASLCLQRTQEEPGYRLARLAHQLISRGTDPSMWRESLRNLSEAECLNPGGR